LTNVAVDYSGIAERKKRISVDGFEIVLNLVRPKDGLHTIPLPTVAVRG